MSTAGYGKGIGLSEMAEVLAVQLPRIPTLERLRMLTTLFGPRTVLTTSFGPTSAVLLHLATRIFPEVCVLNISHGYETSETLEFIIECRRKFSIELLSISAPHLPVPSPIGNEFEEFQKATKIRPLRNTLEKLDIWFWFSGVMHDETGARKTMKMARVRHGAIAVYPLLDWTSEQALEYCISNDLPVNNHYFDPCKGPDQSLECGLHHDENHYSDQ